MKLQSVQSLRALAALMVLLFHLIAIETDMIAHGGHTEAPMIGGLFENGYAGVDLFFVLSGFIIVFVTGRSPPGRYPIGSFLFARAARIYAPWWLFAGTMALYLYVAYGVPWDAEQLSSLGTSPFYHLFASVFLLPQNGFPVLNVGWTLVHEMHFYAIFALLLAVPYRLRVVGLVAWAGAVLAGGLAGLAQPYASSMVSLFFSPHTLEFLMGAFAALLVVNGVRPFPGLMAIAGLFALLLAMVFHELQPEWTLSWGRVIWFGIPSAVLTYGLVSLDVEGRFRSLPGLSAIGDWSYAIYLSHILVLAAIKRSYFAFANLSEAYLGVPPWAADLLRVGVPGPLDNLFLLVSAMIACLFVGWATHRFFEFPILKASGRLRGKLFSGRADGLTPQPIRAMVW